MSMTELSPHGQFPLQLKQAVAAIKYLLDSGLQPSQVSKILEQALLVV